MTLLVPEKELDAAAGALGIACIRCTDLNGLKVRGSYSYPDLRWAVLGALTTLMDASVRPADEIELKGFGE